MVQKRFQMLVAKKTHKNTLKYDATNKSIKMPNKRL